MICERCNKEHNGSYGSGRFCSEKCARSFSSFEKREEINKKVSLKLKGKYHGKTGHNSVIIICRYCGKNRNVPYNKRYYKYCSKSCAMHINGKINGKAKKPGNGGFRDKGGYAKVYEYISPYAGKIKLNKEEIEVAKVLDSLKTNWIRNRKGFEYIDKQGKTRKYHPDFYVDKTNTYVEYKGYLSEKDDFKMKDAVKRNEFKLLIIYGNDKRYKDLGLNLEAIKKNPNLLLL